MANKAMTTLSSLGPQSPPARQISAKRRLIAAAISACFTSAPAWANPVAPQVVNGNASFNQSGKLLTVTNSNGAIINWNSFSIGAGETTRFNQASAASSVLNRVIANDPSVLLGTLSSNGRVWLVNPAGIMVGQGARVDVGGFIASTLNIRNEDFLAGRLNFQATPNAGKVENFGQITAPSGGSVYLIGSAVTNNGIINAPNGDVILAAGQTVSIVDTGTPGVKVDITGAEGNVTNLGQIAAEAGRIGMAGVLVRNSGELNASSVVKEGGRVFLKASQDAYVDGAGRIVTTGTKGGSIEVLGNRVAVMDQAQLDASGSQGGGTVLVGGDYQGKNAAIQNSQITYFGPNASIKADATDKGDGGKVIVWADDTTRAYGNISARGGATSGDGGFVETSGHRFLDVAGIGINAGAANGKGGTWLLDPYNLVVDVSASNATQSGTNPTYWSSGSGATLVNGGDITSKLNLGTSVVLQTTGTLGDGLGSGDITVNTPLATAPNAPATLTLLAHGNIVINCNITSAGNPLTMNFVADQTLAGTGSITIAPSVSLLANNANISFSAATGISIGNSASISTGTGGGWASLSFTANNSGGNGSFLLGTGAQLTSAQDVTINAQAANLYGTIQRVQNNPAVGTSTVAINTAGDITLQYGSKIVGASGGVAYGFNVNLNSGVGNVAVYGGSGIAAYGGNVTLQGSSVTIGEVAAAYGATVSGATNTAINTDNLALWPNALVQSTGNIGVQQLTPTRNLQIGGTDPGGLLYINNAWLQQFQAAGNLSFGNNTYGSATVYGSIYTGDIFGTTLAVRGNDSSGPFSPGVNLVGASIGYGGGPFAHRFIATSNGSVALTGSSIVLANGNNLIIHADDDLNNVGTVTLNHSNIQVGTSSANLTGNTTITGEKVRVIADVSGGSMIHALGGGTQTITASKDVVITAYGGYGAGIMAESGDQTISANRIMLTGSPSGAAPYGGFAGIWLSAGVNGGGGLPSAYGGTQTLNLTTYGGVGGSLSLYGGGTGASDSLSYASVMQQNALGTQVINVYGGGSIYVKGGTGSGIGDIAGICAYGGGPGGCSSNYASISNSGSGGQTFNFFDAPGSISLYGGSLGTQNYAEILSKAGAQSIGVSGNAPSIYVQGGTEGVRFTSGTTTYNLPNDANITSTAVGMPQHIIASTITEQGGASGFGNEAFIGASPGPGLSAYQDITAGSIALIAGGNGAANSVGNGAVINASGGQSITVTGSGITLVGGGGTTGYNNSANINQGGPTGSQTITLTGSNATISLTGGSGAGLTAGPRPGACNNGAGVLTFCDALMQVSNNHAQIKNNFGNQTIDFQLGGSLNVTGGSNGNWNFAEINNSAIAGQQKISSSNGSAYYPSITLTGGASGGGIATAYGGSGLAIDAFGAPVYLRNSATIYSTATAGARQLVNAGSITMVGAGDSATFGGAWILSPYQTIVSNGAVSLSGGAGSSSTYSGMTTAMIGNAWGNADTSLTAGSLGLYGGSGLNSGALIGTRQFGGFVQVNVSGALTAAGSAAGNIGIGSFNNIVPTLPAGSPVGNINIQNAGIYGGSVDLNAPGGSINMSAAAFYTYLKSIGNMTVSAANGINLTAPNTNSLLSYADGSGVELQSGGTQSLSAPFITLKAGTTGHSNFARVQSYGDQTITITGTGGALTLLGGGDASTSVYGGAGSYNNWAQIAHGFWDSNGVASGTGNQLITINGGGSIVAKAGSATGVNGWYGSDCVSAGFSIAACSGSNSSASINSPIGNQTVNFAAGGSIALTGGGAGSGNAASIDTKAAQTISGAPNISIYGGASGGRYIGAAGGQNYTLSNDAGIWSGQTGTQVISAGTIYLSGGGAAFGGASIGAATQTIGTTGNVTIIGGTSVPVSGLTLDSGATAGMGTEGTGSLTLNVGGSLSVTGNASGAFMGAYGGTTNTNVNVSGNLVLASGATPGTVFIGSYLGKGGSIALKSGGSMSLSDARIGTGSTGTSTISLSANGSISEASTANIGTDTLTVSSATGSISLPGQNQATNVTANGATGVTYYSDAPTTHFSGGATGGSVLVQYDPLHAGGGSIGIGTVNASGSVTVNARGAIIDDNATTAGTVNITAGSATLTSATGGAAGGLAISADTAVTGAISATVASGSANGGIRIANYGGAPSSVALTDNATAGAKAGFFNSGDITNTNNYTLKTLNGGDLALQSGGNLTYTGGTLATPSGSALVGAAGTLNVNGTLSTPANVDLGLAGGTAVNVSGAVTTAGTGTIAITAPAVSVGGSLNGGDDVGVIATSLSLGSGSTLNAGHDVIVQGQDVTATNSKVTAGNDINFTLAGDLHLNNGSSLTAGNDIWLALNGGASTLYLNDTAGLLPSYLWAKAPSTIHLTYSPRTSGGIVVDGVAANALDFTSEIGGSGLFYGPSMTPASPGSGLIVLGISNAGLLTPEAILAINSNNAAILSTITSTTTTTPTSTTGINFLPLPALGGPAGGTLTMLNTTQTIGGGEGSFGGSSGAASGSGSGTGSGGGEKSSGDKPADDKSASGKKEDKKDDDKKKDDEGGPKKAADKPAPKKLATCS
ncbi:MAG: filamentous hemagglutinin N-terminal domain-containing protein [Proteobacteria bacterium]|nr:filamentous hemagglutinin N-terminal domain-containing protein [Pseudomonadota bacterium]